ncbi:hypothetical protein CLV92_107241 [Kineococcus xinjiangensis]|uniref:Uncharacterized protein n=1 Tax=Kineococcus xinjiangensis TaxID=512762 RepID=A0A2S6IKL1_9ACTN|nr:hypothetical protein [Kineococcus xinjiangensis]PPK94738.1 hypothetical protein CLV92_107241 [Kineococcus xinjiangensis]
MRQLLELPSPDGSDWPQQLRHLVAERLVVVEPTRDPQVLDGLLLRCLCTDPGPTEDGSTIHRVRFPDGTESPLSRHTLALIEECDEGKSLGATVTEMQERGAPPGLFPTMLNQDLPRLFPGGYAFFDWTPTASRT